MFESDGTKKERPEGLSFLVPVTGLEPVRHRWRRILSPLRLLVSHTGGCNIFSYAIYALRECRCPVAVPEISSSQSAREISTAAPRSPRFFRHRRRSARSPNSHRSATLMADFESATSTCFSHRQVCMFIACLVEYTSGIIARESFA